MLKKKIYSVLKRAYPTVDRLFNRPWHDQPFTKKPLARIEKYQELFSKIQGEIAEEIKSYEKRSGFSIDRTWLFRLALHTQIVIKSSPLCFQHGFLLYSALRQYIQKRSLNYINIIETGTARGFSSLCMAKALSESGLEGKIMTFDVLPHTTAMYWNCIDDLEGLKTRATLLSRYQDLIDRYLIYIQGDTKVSMMKSQLSRVHFAFLDGAHTYKDLMGEYQYLREKQQTGDVIVFDDYVASAFPGVVKGVDEICSEYGYEKEILISNQRRSYVIATKK